MRISTIVAVAKGGVIGKENATPWYLPAELAHFKQITTGHPIIMGRKTHESIGRALPGRINIVISHNSKYKAAEGVIVAGSLNKALDIASAKDQDEIFIIGGEAIYNEALPKVNKIYLTKVEASVDGDKFFEYDSHDWQEVSSQKYQADEKNKYNYEFIVLERKHK